MLSVVLSHMKYAEHDHLVSLYPVEYFIRKSSQNDPPEALIVNHEALRIRLNRANTALYGQEKFLSQSVAPRLIPGDRVSKVRLRAGTDDHR